ncbi:serine/threonine protein kinase [Actinospica sp. MGRD01-02]|uniref:non-specific serine/threonine protein kinase n=1 Tax=Actinospica acidithermotolerans TaxID=2828514 RepID=A0A941EBG7_9ACTN|nr:protein kinase [Actinospica acidithermotolerans]MBR7827260.1 serine/threonine protein kinase [Actinospica acidithermotolerans]
MTRRIGSRYTVTRVIGRGTCGTVWSGEGPEGPVAIKLLHEDLTADQTLIARFVQERTVLTGLRHPRIVGVRDLVVDGNDLALVMDLLNGPDLRGRLDREGPMPPEQAAGVCADIAEALAAAHEKGIVHRDVKPENVLVDAVGRGRLTDFGIARLVDGPRRSRATRIVGTPDYLAPEVIEGCPPGPAVDVYALATVLFELTTGWTPFGGGHPGAVLRRHVTEPAPRVPGMPERLTELMDRCLAKSPAARLSAAEFAAALRECRPALAGLPALRVASPRGNGSYPTGSAVHAGAVPLVQAATDPLSDDSRSTHINQMKPIKEPIDPDEEAERPRGGAPRQKRRRPRWLPAAIGLGLILLSVLGFAFSGGSGSAGNSDPAADAARATAATEASAAASATPTGLTALPESGGFGFAAYSSLPAPSSPVVGAVQLAYFDGFLYAAATGTDGNVRVASVPAGTSTTSANWTIVPGVASTVQPALDGASSGLELYATAQGGNVMRAVLTTPGNGWSGWTRLGTVHAAGAPAAAADGGRTVVVVATPDKHLVEGTVAADGEFTAWQQLPQAGLIDYQVAVAAHGGAVAVYVVRASDGATMRVYNDGKGWQYAWPTGATGQPATAYAADGHPDLFVLSASAGLQVFEFSGAELHGTMTWASAGVAAVNPPGVTSVPGGGVALAAVNSDGSVSVYTTSR